MRIGILTVSDRSFNHQRQDASGPALISLATEQRWQIVITGIVPDEIDAIKEILIAWADDATTDLDLILTTGGTGFTPRDVTPEATMAVIERLTPGLAEAMRFESMKITPHAMLSRAVAGIRGHTLIINFPGSPKAAVENLKIVLPVLGHAVDLIKNRPEAEAGHRAEKTQ